MAKYESFVSYEHILGKDLEWLWLGALDFMIFAIWICIFLHTFSNSITLHCIPCKCALRFLLSAWRSRLPAKRTTCSSDLSFFDSFPASVALEDESSHDLVLLVAWSKLLSLNCWEISAWTADLEGNFGFWERCMQDSAESFSWFNAQQIFIFSSSDNPECTCKKNRFNQNVTNGSKERKWSKRRSSRITMFIRTRF